MTDFKTCQEQSVVLSVSPLSQSTNYGKVELCCGTSAHNTEKNELQKEKRKIYPLKRILIYIISKDSVRTAQ